MTDDDLWLDALLDDELDAPASLALQRRLAAEPALQRRLDERRALRDAIRTQATRHAAPDALRAHLMAMLPHADASGPTAPSRADAQAGAPGARASARDAQAPGRDAQADAPGAQAAAHDAVAGTHDTATSPHDAPASSPADARAHVRTQASSAMPADPRASLERRGSRAGVRRRMALPWLTGLGGALAATLCTLAVVDPAALGWRHGEAMASLQTAEASEAVSAHTRALLVDHPIEVASSDQHTVRPWLSARLNFVPPVTDFAPQGYPLVGARRDVLSGETAAALVYRHGAHVVSVFVRPVDPAATRAVEATRVVRGFNVIERTQGGLAFCFVSDANPHELRALADLVAPLAVG